LVLTALAVPNRCGASLAEALATRANSMTGNHWSQPTFAGRGTSLGISSTVGFKTSDFIFATQLLQTQSLGSAPTEYPISDIDGSAHDTLVAESEPPLPRPRQDRSPDDIGVHSVSIFFSPVGSVGSGAVFGSPALRYDGVGETGSVFVWLDPRDAALMGVSLNLLSSTPGVIAFEDATVFNPAIVAIDNDGSVVDDRWAGTRGGDITTDAVVHLAGFRVMQGAGLDPRLNGADGLLDQGYDSKADAFLFARIDYRAVGEGSTDLFLQIGKLGISPIGGHSSDMEVFFGEGEEFPLNGDADRGFSSALADATITVGAGAAVPATSLRTIPEPSAAILVLSCLASFALTARRLAS